MPLSIDDFDSELRRLFRAANEQALPFIEVNAGHMHRSLGGYPGKENRMPVCCDVMHRHLSPRDVVLSSPPKGRGASLTIRYALPR